MPWVSNRAAVIDRFFQLLLAIVIVGVIYRYCWIGMSAQILWGSQKCFQSLYQPTLLYRYLGSLQMQRAPQSRHLARPWSEMELAKSIPELAATRLHDARVQKAGYTRML